MNGKKVKVKKIIFFIFITFISCGIESKKTQNEGDKQEAMSIIGNHCKALYVATTNFYRHNYPIERYKIKIINNDNDDFYTIYFLPEIIDYETADYGAQDFGNGVYYWISKDTYEIIKITYDR